MDLTGKLLSEVVNVLWTFSYKAEPLKEGPLGANVEDMAEASEKKDEIEANSSLTRKAA